MKISVRSLLPIFAIAIAPSIASAEDSISNRLTNEGMTITASTFSDMPIHEMMGSLQQQFIFETCGPSPTSLYLCAQYLRDRGGVDMTGVIKSLYSEPKLQ